MKAIAIECPQVAPRSGAGVPTSRGVLLEWALWAGAVLAVLLASGCAVVSTPPVEVELPKSSRNAAIESAPPIQANGAIFQAGAHRGLFEDRRARKMGDLLTISIEEKTSAKQSSTSSVDRNGKVAGSLSAMPFTSAGALAKLGVGGQSTNSFEGKGQTDTSNLFTGTITVTVVEVLPNGNMVVAGEKQVGINQNVEVLRFGGIVNPTTILPNNSVSSTQVADARVQVRSKGDIDKAQTTGWLSRFFLSWLPI